MSQLTNKNILILSPQNWGTMFLSKHHYAIELAKKGNKVFFLNPPEQTGKKIGIIINPSGIHDNLFLIEHSLFFSYKIKFHAIGLFHWLMKFHVKELVKKIPAKIDIVWSFDLGNWYPFRAFPSGVYKIFHPVDEPQNKAAIESVAGADIIFSVTNEILDKYKFTKVPGHFINHGISADFLKNDTVAAAVAPGPKKINIGFSGNLMRNEIDREILLKIINENPDKLFNFWGVYDYLQSNIGGGGDPETAIFIDQLHACKNVTLHGAISSENLATAIQDVDAFLICYDVIRDQSKGTNYHKVMEFISTGKVIISNNITTYQHQPNLVQMVAERDHNQSLPGLFKKVTDNLEAYNSPGLQLERKNFAKNNTYKMQLQRIEALIYAS